MLFKNEEYVNSLYKCIPWLDKREGNILITGATGLIGTYIIDLLIYTNKINESKFNIFALGRNREKIVNLFGNDVIPIIQDIVEPIKDVNEYDYIIHCASNADPKSYASNPVETMLINLIGCRNILDYCKKHKSARLLLTSTFEVYGHLDGVISYSEDMSGIIDQTILRNGYPESKRSCELLLRSYVEEYGISAVIARLPSVYGPTMKKNDSKAHAQFINNALHNKNIVLKSNGEQKRTYCYVADVVSAIFAILFRGKDGDVYNISNENSIASIYDVAKTCSLIAGTDIIFDLPNDIEKKGYSQKMDCVLDNTKILELGWRPQYSLLNGLQQTIKCLKEDREEKNE